MAKKSREMGLTSIPSLAVGAIDRLSSYDWPGNVRELENAVERALILSSDGVLNFDEFQAPRHTERPPPQDYEPESMLLDNVVAEHIQKALRMTNGRVEGPRGAGTLLGVKSGTLRHRMRKLGIPFGRRAGADGNPTKA
jgi:DNA-binding NtrC family response regulator